MNSTNPAVDPLELALQAVPEPAPDTEAKMDPSGRLHLRRRMPSSNRFLRWLFSGQWIRVQLDVRGAHMWQRINGRRSLAVLAEEIERDQGIGPEESRAAVVAFTKMLMLRHLIVLRTPQPTSQS